MQKLFTLGCAAVLLALSANRVSAQATQTNTNSTVKIKASEAKENVGKEAVVVGTVAEVNKAPNLVRLNLDKSYPNQPFTAVIFSRNTNAFGDLEMLKGKKVEISGKISEFRGRPQIILTSTNQLKRIEAAEEKK